MIRFCKRKVFLIIITLLTYSELGQGLVCFVCHSRSEEECLDPFVGNKTDAIDCQRVRDVGLGIVAAASALGVASLKYSALDQPPHVCFKLAYGHNLVRGCGKPDVCQNYTETECGTCDSDGCNSSSLRKPIFTYAYALLISLILCSY